MKKLLLLLLLPFASLAQTTLPANSKVINNIHYQSPDGRFFVFKGAAYAPNAYFEITKKSTIDSLLALKGDVTLTGAQTLTNKTLTAPLGIVKGDVGLGLVDNTSDVTKNAASVTLTNKTISGATNTITNIPDGALSANIPKLNIGGQFFTTGSGGVKGDFGTIGGMGFRISNTNPSGYSELVFNNDNTQSNGTFVFGYGGSSSAVANTAYFVQRLNAPILFYSNNIERFRLSGAGNLVIGSLTDNTVDRLQVTGSITSTGQIKNTVATGTAPFIVSSTTAVANLTANTVTTNANLTGDVTSVGNVTTFNQGAKLIKSRFASWVFLGGGITAISSTNISAPNSSGTATSRAIDFTTYAGQLPRLGTVSAATAGATGAYRQTVTQYALKGGFTFNYVFMNADAATVAGARTAVGLVGTGGTLPNAEPSSNLNVIILANDGGDANMQVMSNDGTGIATKINLGANFPANTLSADVYQISLTAVQNATSVDYVVTRKSASTGAILFTASGTISTDLPASTQMMAIQAWRNNNTTALAVGLDHSVMTIEVGGL